MNYLTSARKVQPLSDPTLYTLTLLVTDRFIHSYQGFCLYYLAMKQQFRIWFGCFFEKPKLEIDISSDLSVAVMKLPCLTKNVKGIESERIRTYAGSA